MVCQFSSQLLNLLSQLAGGTQTFGLLCGSESLFPGNFKVVKMVVVKHAYVRITEVQATRRRGNSSGKHSRQTVTATPTRVLQAFTFLATSTLSIWLCVHFHCPWCQLLVAENDVTDWSVLYAAVSVVALYCTHVFRCCGGLVWCVASYALCGC